MKRWRPVWAAFLVAALLLACGTAKVTTPAREQTVDLATATNTPQPLTATNSPAPPTETPIPPTETPAPSPATSVPSDTPSPAATATKPAATATKPAATATSTNPPAARIVIVTVNKRDEYVDIQNSGDAPQNLDGWVLISEKGNQRCLLSGTLQPGVMLRIWALDSDRDQGGFNCGFKNNIWNNDEPDAAVLVDASGHEVARR